MTANTQFTRRQVACSKELMEFEMKNTLNDLNNHLFAQLERLGDESITGEELEREINRAASITSVSKEIVNNASLQLSAAKLKAEYLGLRVDDLPALVGGSNG